MKEVATHCLELLVTFLHHRTHNRFFTKIIFVIHFLFYYENYLGNEK